MRYLLLILALIVANSCKENGVERTSAQKTLDTFSELNNTNKQEGKIIKFISKYSFDSFKAELYNGKLAQPSFIGNEFAKDKGYVNFIKGGCNDNKINFAGHYTIIQKSCGAMCENIFIIDRINGKIFTDINLNDGRYGYLYHNDSKMLIANSNVFQDDSLKYYNNFFGEPELYFWTDMNFKPLK